MLSNIVKKIDYWCQTLSSTSASLVVASLAFLVRIPFVILTPARSPDSDNYLTIGNNIFHNGCVSLSDPLTSICVPIWGGNHLPGYPAFIALFGGNDAAILAAQTLLYSAACFYLIRALWNFWQNPAGVLAIGIILALSPLQIGWGRFVLPDLLAHTVFIWIVAELVISIRDEKLRWFHISIASACALFLRYDGVLVAIPIAITGIWLHGVRVALGKGLLIMLVVSVPFGAWWARSVAHGLDWIPEQRFMYDGSFVPNGYRAWVRTWSNNLTDSGRAAYPVSTKNYNQIIIAPEAWDSEVEKKQVSDLLAELNKYEEQDFPWHIDDAFRELAAERRNRNSIRQYVTLTAQRAVQFWFSPYYSFGFPGIEMGNVMQREDRIKAAEGGVADKLSMALKYPVPALGKAILFGYRVLLFLFVPLMVFYVGSSKEWRYRCLSTALFGFGFTKVLLLSFQASVDTRYLLSVFAAVEIFAVFWYFRVFSSTRKI